MNRKNRERQSVLLGWAGLLAVASMALGCGPWFPNTLLDEGDEAVLQAPRAVFAKELERMKLLAPSTRSDRDLLDADLSDLRAALERATVPLGTREEIIQAYREEREKIYIPHSGSLRPTNQARLKGPLPQIVPGLPGEFGDYFEGAIAWHQDKMPDARAAWMRLLERPARERHFKSTWASFMLGRSWEEENRKRAIGYLQEVRVLAKSGFADTLGLAVSSLGYEARLHLREKRFREGIKLYLEQANGGDPSAMLSMRFAARHALEHGASALREVAEDPIARKVLMAYVIDAGRYLRPIDVDPLAKEILIDVMGKAAAKAPIVPAPKPSWHKFRHPVVLWLEAVEAANVRDVQAAEQLALAAYQVGDMETAQRWLKRALSTPVTQWLQAKLLLREGKVDEAAAFLAQVCRSFPVAAIASQTQSNTLAGNLYLDKGDLSIIPAAFHIWGEAGVFCLARRQYTEALQALLQSGYWMDAAFVAERVLTLAELKAFVDQRWPAVPEETGKEVNIEWGEADVAGAARAQNSRAQIRYLLARRLVRENRFREARPYYPAAFLPVFDKLFAALSTAENSNLTAAARAQGYFEAAIVTRQSGLELAGTEVEPDWRIHHGNYQEGVTVQQRASLGTNFLAASAEEIERSRQHAADPEVRWHYRYTAGVLAGNGARLLRDAEMPGVTKEERARILFEAARKIQPLDWYASVVASSAETGEPALLDPYPSAILAWKAGQLLANNSDETARVLCLGGTWIKGMDPEAADLFYKSLVRRCRKTAIGAEADRLRWFPRLNNQGNLKTEESPASTDQ